MAQPMTVAAYLVLWTLTVQRGRTAQPDVWYRTDDGWFVFPGTDTVPPATPKDPCAKERLLPGDPRAKVTAFFIEWSGRQHTVQQVVNDIGHTKAAVDKAIQSLVAEGTLIRAGGRPRRYRIRPGA